MRKASLIDYAMVAVILLAFVHAAAVEIKNDILSRSNLTLSRLLDEQLTANAAKLSELELAIATMYDQPPRVADSLRMAMLK